MNIRNDVLPKFGVLALGLFLILVFSILQTSLFGNVELEKHFYFEIVFLLLIAIVGEILVLYTGQPSVMLLMILGAFMSESFLHLLFESLNSFGVNISTPSIIRLEEVLKLFAQLGAVILLFKVGMENKIEKIFAKDNLLVAIAGIIIPFAVGYGYASVTGGNFAYSMFLAAALTATSVGVTVAILKEFKMMQERVAQVIIGAAILDDVLGLLVLSFVINVTGPSGFSVESLATTLVMAVLFLLGGILAGKHLVRYLDRKELHERRFLVVLATMLFFAYIAEFIHLSAIVGAFIAGIVFNSSKHHKEIEEKTYGLEMLFVPIFFIHLGTLIDVNALYVFAVPIIVISILAILSKFIGCFIAALAAKLKVIEAAIIGAGMSPRGEVALIVAAIGLSNGILNSSEYSIIASMALITTFLAPPILQHLIQMNKKAGLTKDGVY